MVNGRGESLNLINFASMRENLKISNKFCASGHCCARLERLMAATWACILHTFDMCVDLLHYKVQSLFLPEIYIVIFHSSIIVALIYWMHLAAQQIAVVHRDEAGQKSTLSAARHNVKFEAYGKIVFALLNKCIYAIIITQRALTSRGRFARSTNSLRPSHSLSCPTHFRTLPANMKFFPII